MIKATDENSPQVHLFDPLKAEVATANKIHLADRRRAVTVCGAVVSARQIGIYAESLLILADKTIVRREVFIGFERVKRSYRCKSCFRRVERIL